MKVYLGPYKNYIGPYQIAELLQKVGVSKDKCHDIGDKLAETPLNNICHWIDSKRKRKIKIKIHKYDAWNAYVTMAQVCLPIIKQLKEDKHGAGYIDDEDVPEGIKSTDAPFVEKHETDDNHFKRYDWVLDEIIFALECCIDSDWEDQFHSGNIDIKWVPVEGNIELTEMTKGPNDTHVFDKEGYMKWNKRIDHGLFLFGKYFRTFWD